MDNFLIAECETSLCELLSVYEANVIRIVTNFFNQMDQPNMFSWDDNVKVQKVAHYGWPAFIFIWKFTKRPNDIEVAVDWLHQNYAEKY